MPKAVARIPHRVRSLMLRARSTVPYALWAGVEFTNIDRGANTAIPVQQIPVHVAASRRVPYQPQASPAWRCDSITTLPSSARVFSSVAGGAPIVPFSSSGADGVRESACHHVSPFGASIHPIIRRLTMELGGNTTKAATTHPRNLHSEGASFFTTTSITPTAHFTWHPHSKNKRKDCEGLVT
ncbi:hypothetical protein V496_05061 [Pseudogymnoascus sp. VKM F-4515 (FW-2607)]|nr:hypothetical protein V496_05061 [Pseudogymnoascus sp. VKM F-4515 (FW-2607)]